MDQLLGGADIVARGNRLSGHALRIEAGRIAAILPDDRQAPGRTALPEGAILAPGFIDIQVNGGGGIQFNADPTAEAAAAIATAHRTLGTVSILPTLITDAPDRMPRAAEAAAAAGQGRGVIGLHLEGPFLSPDRPGVHPPEWVRAPEAADLALLESLPARLGKPVVLTVAPEIMPPGSIDRLRAAGVRVCAGHSAATFEQVPRMSGFTHVFNAMRGGTARDPGIVAAALLDDEAYAGVIADGVHVHDAMLRLLLRCKALERILLVSDAMAPAGTALHEFMLQGRRILRRDGRLTTENGTLAGADLCLAQAVRHMIGLGVKLPTAIAMASTNPADFLGIAHERGRIAIGLAADLVLLSSEMNVLGTWRDGAWMG